MTFDIALQKCTSLASSFAVNFCVFAVRLAFQNEPQLGCRFYPTDRFGSAWFILFLSSGFRLIGKTVESSDALLIDWSKNSPVKHCLVKIWLCSARFLMKLWQNAQQRIVAVAKKLLKWIFFMLCALRLLVGWPIFTWGWWVRPNPVTHCTGSTLERIVNYQSETVLNSLARTTHLRDVDMSKHGWRWLWWFFVNLRIHAWAYNHADSGVYDVHSHIDVFKQRHTKWILRTDDLSTISTH